MRIYLLFILLFFSSTLYSQSLLNVKHYSVQDGLSQKNIQNFQQDANGYIWMSTWNGLERFDGYSFCNYKTYPNSSIRITNHRFTNIKTSSLNNIWCMTYDNRLYFFDTHKYKYEDVFQYTDNLSNSISELYVLNDGITWGIGTGKELFRIDEKKLPNAEAIQVYTNKNTLGDNIYNIVQDKEGDEWILTNKGAVIVGRKTIANQMPFEFMVESAGNIYLATSKGFLAQYDAKGKEVIPCVPDSPLSDILGLYTLNNDRIAILHSNGVMVYTPSDKAFVSYETKIKPNFTFYQERDNVIWILGQTSNVTRLDYQNGIIASIDYPKIKEVSFTMLKALVHEDEFGCVWVKPTDGELCFYNQETKCLEQAYVYDMGIRVPIKFQAFNYLVDQHRNLWYTNGDGFGCLSFRQKNFDYISNVQQGSGRAIMEDHKERLWIGWKRNHKKEDGKVGLYDSSGQWIGNLSDEGRIISDTNVKFNVDVYCIYEDSKHNVWLGTKENGLFLLQPKGENNYKITHYLPREEDKFSLSSTSVYSIIQDSKGRIWIGTYGAGIGGINLIDKLPENGELKFIHAGNLLNNYPIHSCEKVRCLYETSDGVLMIGSTGGLLSFSLDFSRPEEIRFYHNICDERYSSLSNNDVMNITQPRSGKLLFTTLSGGIDLLEKGNLLTEKLLFKHYNATNGQTPDLSLSTIEDLKGNIWVTSENKLAKFDAEMNLLEEYGNQMFMAETKPVLCSSGKIVFGLMFGAFCVTPHDTQKSNFVPPIVFSHLDIYMNNTSRRQDVYSHNDMQVLGVDERNFMVTFAALDYVDSYSIKYAYRIKGLNDQWIDLGNNRSANLANVPAGDYVFQVKSTNADGVWVDNVTSLSIQVKPTFWETVWAIILYVLLSVILLGTVVYVVIRITNLKRKVDFEQQIANLKLRFFTDISHELRTPLTLIASPIDEVIGNEKLSDTGLENMQVAKRNTDRMLRLINQILDFRKIQNDKMKVLVEQVDVIPFIVKIYENFVPMAHNRHIDFQYVCDFDSLFIYTDVDKLEKILFNLLSNAFKYTPNEKSIVLSVSHEKEVICLSVKDEGRGINAQKINQLFTRFETLDEADPNISTGIGLSLVKELLNLLHGTIKVESKLGEGSRFTVTLPGSAETFEGDAYVEFILNDNSKTELVKETVEYLSEEEKEPRILIIEDNEELRHFICNVLGKDYVVLEAGNGRQGLDITLTDLPDIVISDIMMPEMDGIEYLKAVKENSDICHIPVILLSAKSSLNDQIQGLEYGADDYITKPFSSTYLKARVDSLLKRRQILYDYYTSKMKCGKEMTLLEQMAPSVPQVTHFDDDFIKNILQSVEENIQSSDFKIDDLAEAMGMSRTVFYRKVKSLMGVSPVDFVKTMRIKRAVQLLEQNEYTISEVGYMSGFATPQYFSKVFKEAMGCTPKEYKIKK